MAFLPFPPSAVAEKKIFSRSGKSFPPPVLGIRVYSASKEPARPLSFLVRCIRGSSRAPLPRILPKLALLIFPATVSTAWVELFSSRKGRITPWYELCMEPGSVWTQTSLLLLDHPKLKLWGVCEPLAAPGISILVVCSESWQKPNPPSPKGFLDRNWFIQQLSESRPPLCCVVHEYPSELASQAPPLLGRQVVVGAGYEMVHGQGIQQPRVKLL